MCVQKFKTIITSHRLSKEQALDAVEKVFANMANRRKNLLLVGKDLKVVSEFDNAAAVVALVHTDNVIAESSFLEDVFFDRFHFSKKAYVNIAFFEPVGHNLGLRGSVLCVQKWVKEHYPEYHATLISEYFSSLAEDCGLEAFYDCWLRELENEGWPQYREHPTAACNRYIEGDDKLPNVYASLVLSPEEFKQINPSFEAF